MEIRPYNYALLNAGEFGISPLLVLDGGVEVRGGQTGSYDFSNDQRPDYHGYLFQYTLRGRGLYERGGQQYMLTPGKGFLTAFPDESRYALPAEQDAYWAYVYLHFDGPAAAPFVQTLLTRYGSVCTLAASARPVRLLLQFQEQMSSGHRPEKYAGGEFLYQFLSAFLREAEFPTPPGGGSMVSHSITIMESEFRTLTGMEELARRLQVSAAYFSRAFKAQTGQSPIRFLTNLRLQHAMTALLNTDAPLASIAENSGFATGNYFCKVFLKAVGVTPTTFRAQHHY